MGTRMRYVLQHVLRAFRTTTLLTVLLASGCRLSHNEGQDGDLRRQQYGIQTANQVRASLVYPKLAFRPLDLTTNFSQDVLRVEVFGNRAHDRELLDALARSIVVTRESKEVPFATKVGIDLSEDGESSWIEVTPEWQDDDWYFFGVGTEHVGLAIPSNGRRLYSPEPGVVGVRFRRGSELRITDLEVCPKLSESDAIPRQIVQVRFSEPVVVEPRGAAIGVGEMDLSNGVTCTAEDVETRGVSSDARIRALCLGQIVTDLQLIFDGNDLRAPSGATILGTNGAGKWQLGVDVRELVPTADGCFGVHGFLDERLTMK